MTPEERAGLETERDFLLRSLDDLEEERAVADVDDGTYQSLHDDYTRARGGRDPFARDRHRSDAPGSAAVVARSRGCSPSAASSCSRCSRRSS